MAAETRGILTIPVRDNPPDPNTRVLAYLSKCHEYCPFYNECDPDGKPKFKRIRSGPEEKEIFMEVKITGAHAGYDNECIHVNG